MEKRDEAVKKLTEEMMKIDTPLAQLLEEYLSELCEHPAVAEKVIASKKTLKDLEKKLWDIASDRKKGRGAYIPKDEIYEMAREYFGITEVDYTEQQEATNIDVLDFL